VSQPNSYRASSEALFLSGYNLTMRISRRQIKEAAFWGLIVLGIGLCIGGVFHPAIAAAGIACFGAASAVRNRPEHQNPEYDNSGPQIQAVDQEIDIDLGHHNNVLILRNAPCPEYRLSNQQEEQKERPADYEASVIIHSEKPPF
jgi:hypothetical protein